MTINTKIKNNIFYKKYDNYYYIWSNFNGDKLNDDEYLYYFREICENLYYVKKIIFYPPKSFLLCYADITSVRNNFLTIFKKN